MKAATIRQHCVWAILHAGQAVKNRVWSNRYRGLAALHAAKAVDGSDQTEFLHQG